jgi:hypothetical protein
MMSAPAAAHVDRSTTVLLAWFFQEHALGYRGALSHHGGVYLQPGSRHRAPRHPAPDGINDNQTNKQTSNNTHAFHALDDPFLRGQCTQTLIRRSTSTGDSQCWTLLRWMTILSFSSEECVNQNRLAMHGCSALAGCFAYDNLCERCLQVARVDCISNG